MDKDWQNLTQVIIADNIIRDCIIGMDIITKWPKSKSIINILKQEVGVSTNQMSFNHIDQIIEMQIGTNSNTHKFKQIVHQQSKSNRCLEYFVHSDLNKVQFSKVIKNKFLTQTEIEFVNIKESKQSIDLINKQFIQSSQEARVQTETFTEVNTGSVMNNQNSIDNRKDKQSSKISVNTPSYATVELDKFQGNRKEGTAKQEVMCLNKTLEITFYSRYYPRA